MYIKHVKSHSLIQQPPNLTSFQVPLSVELERFSTPGQPIFGLGLVVVYSMTSSGDCLWEELASLFLFWPVLHKCYEVVAILFSAVQTIFVQ